MKKILSVLLVAVLVVGMSLGTFAASATATIKNIDLKNFQANLKTNATNGLILLNKTKVATPEALANLSVSGDSEVKIYLTANMFLDNQGNKISDTASYLSTSQIRNGKVGLRRASSRNSSLFDSIAIKSDKNGCYISVKFVENYVSLEEKDFSVTLYFTINSERKYGSEITIAGTMENQIVEVYSDDDYVDLSDGRVAEAVESVRSIEVDLGNDLLLVTRMAKNKKYYGVCSIEPSAADDAVMSKYNGIEMVYTLRTINLKTADGSKVALFDMGDRLYAYNAQGEYLGTTDGKLAYSNKYYLSAKKYDSLDI